MFVEHVMLVQYMQEYIFCHKLKLSNPYIFGVNLWYIKLRLFNLTKFTVWNIPLNAMLLVTRSSSFLQVWKDRTHIPRSIRTSVSAFTPLHLNQSINQLLILIMLKVIIILIPCDPPCKDAKAWFTMVPLQSLSDP